MSGWDKRSRGFTILELMFVLSIISILAMVALPLYMDYSVRAKVSEALLAASMPKTAVVEAYYMNGTPLPVSNAQAGLGAPTEYHSNYVESVQVGNVPVAGTITVTMDLSELGADNQLQLVPSVGQGVIRWACQAAAVNGIKAVHLPYECR